MNRYKTRTVDGRSGRPYLVRSPRFIQESIGPGKRGHIVAHVSWAAQTGKHMLRTQNVSEQNQRHFLCPGHKICIRNKCCARGQTGKHLCRKQCVLVCQGLIYQSKFYTQSVILASAPTSFPGLWKRGLHQPVFSVVRSPQSMLYKLLDQLACSFFSTRPRSSPACFYNRPH